MEQAILPDHLRIGIAKDGHFVMNSVVPNLARMCLIIDADSDHSSIDRVEIRFPLRELAQLLYAEGSPVSAVEVQHDFVSTLRRERKVLPGSIAQSEVWSSLLCGGCDLRFGIDIKSKGYSYTKHNHQYCDADQYFLCHLGDCAPQRFQMSIRKIVHPLYFETVSISR